MNEFIAHVAFERVGRRRFTDDDPLVPFKANDADDLAEQIFRHIKSKKLLASKMFEVEVDLDHQSGTIDGGRFGTFSFSVELGPHVAQFAEKKRG